MSGPNLSEYFTNDAPSMFDEIATNTVVAPVTALSPAISTAPAPVSAIATATGN